MTVRLAVLTACVAGLVGAGGCASVSPAPPPPPPPSTLARADSRLAAADYRGAASLYDEFLRESPNDPAAGRARATRAAIDRMVQAQTEGERLRSEVDRLRAEIDRLKAETTRLRADLERLRIIDLRQTPPTR